MPLGINIGVSVSGRAAGGGGVTTVHLTEGTSQGVDPNQCELTYSGAVSAAAFTGTEFSSDVTLQTSTSVAQSGPTNLLVTFPDPLDAGEVIVYGGSVPGVLNPDSITLDA